jgi:hypothetical protein
MASLAINGATLGANRLAVIGDVNLEGGTSDLTVGGTSTFTGLSTMNGGLTSNGTTNLNTGANATGTNIGNAASTTTVLGTTNINTTGTTQTTLGSSTSQTVIGGGAATANAELTINGQTSVVNYRSKC